MEILFKALAIAGMFSLIVLSHELGHYLAARKVGVKVKKFSLGFGRTLLTKKIGETEFVLSLIPLGGYIKMTGEDLEEELKESDQPRSFQKQPLLKRAIIVLAGSVFNILLALVLLVLVFYFGINVPAPVIATVEENSPADIAGMKPGDIISELNGIKVTTYEGAIRIIQANPEHKIAMTLLRTGKTINTFVTPIKKRGYDPFNRQVYAGYLGVTHTNKQVLYRQDFMGSIRNALEKAWEMISLVSTAVMLLIKGQLPLNELGGPIMIAKISSQQINVGFQNFISTIAFLSVNIGIINLLPVPVLDGGFLLFFLFEKFRGKPLRPKTMQLIQRISVTSLTLLAVFVFYNDILKIVLNLK